MRRSLLIVVSAFSILFFTESVKAEGLFLHPRLGAAVQVGDGDDTAVSTGIVLGYEITDYLSFDILNYSYLWNPDYYGHIIRSGFTLSYDLPVFHPYMESGAGAHKFHSDTMGWYDTNALIYIGAGADLELFGPLSLGGGITYDILNNGPDYVTPYLSLSFIL